MQTELVANEYIDQELTAHKFYFWVKPPFNPLMPTQLVHTNFCDGLRLKW